VDLERRGHGPREQRDRRVLHDERVDAGSGRGADVVLDHGELVFEHQRVERQVQPRARAVDAVRELRQAIDAEVGRPRPGVQAPVEPQVHSVGARGERGREGVVVARGGQDLWAHGPSVA
jgi:hypothetical protein